jgi:tripeptide aminopeptidase
MPSSVIERFIRYTTFDTQAMMDAEVFPSTPGQLVLARALVEELRALGLSEVDMDKNGYVMATLPANTGEPAPVIGFIAHIDTSYEMTGANVRAQFVDYQGGDIVLNAEKGIVLSPREFPDLNQYIGKTLITTDGNTLLGADDKAGIAAIMAALEHLIHHPEIEHGKIRVCFTPDEEVGRGADFFDVAKFGADFAYTVDGGEVGELQYENFNACRVKIRIQGRSVHPGWAKNKMINAVQVAAELNAMLPAHQRPEYTENYEGYYHLNEITADVEEANLVLNIRDHDRAKFEAMKKYLLDCAALLNQRYGEGTITLKMTDQYYNMREVIEPRMYIIDLARQAMLDCGVQPIVEPIRGGTDGSRLSYMGLPCPNIFTGGHNPHGRYEYIPVFALEKAAEVVARIAELAVNIAL